MAISKEFIELLDVVEEDIAYNYSDVYFLATTEKLVSRFSSGFTNLSVVYKNWTEEFYAISFITRVKEFFKQSNHSVVRNTLEDSFIHMACIAYLLLSKITDTPIETLLTNAKQLHVNKNAGYSPDPFDAWQNFRTCNMFELDTLDGAVTRLCDKYTRFMNVHSNQDIDLVNEAATDTLLDFGAYCLICVCLLREKYGRSF